MFNMVLNTPLFQLNQQQSLLTQLTFTYSKLTIETLEKSEICSKLTIKTPE